MRPRMLPVSVMACLFVLSLMARPVSAQSDDVPVLQANDASLSDRIGQTVIIEGVVASAAWSQTGKVMEIRFVGVTDAKGFTAVVFDRNRKAMDEAFGGDLAKALNGATVRLKGKLRPYGGRAKSLEGRIEMTLDKPDQVTVTSAATSQPSNP